MPTKKHIITLTQAERDELEKVARSTHRSVREKLRARILLLSDTVRSDEAGDSLCDEAIASRLHCAPMTVYKVRRRACERGATAVVEHREQTQRKARKLDGEQEAKLIAVVCSAPPEGCARWSLRLIRDRLIEMEVVEQIGLETIRTTLKKTRSSLG